MNENAMRGALRLRRNMAALLQNLPKETLIPLMPERLRSPGLQTDA